MPNKFDLVVKKTGESGFKWPFHYPQLVDVETPAVIMNNVIPKC